MDAALREDLARALGRRVLGARRVRGGDVHPAWRVELEDGTSAFVKTASGVDPRVLPAEARGLIWLAEGPVRIPRVLAVAPGFLALEWIEPGPPAQDASELLGRGLAALHALGAPCFGLDHDNFLAAIPQDNTPEPDWATFYARRRLEPLVRRVADRGLLSSRARRALERVIARMPELAGPPEPPARLHGDLWSGNRMHDATGAPVLVDPAVYGGHREVDLAMMRLFGGFDARTFAAYEEHTPLAPGHEERVPLWQLLPLLVHVLLFGPSYLGALETALGRIR